MIGLVAQRTAAPWDILTLNYYYYFLMNEKLKYRYQVNVADVNIYVCYKLLQPK